MKFSLIAVCLVAFIGINNACDSSYPNCGKIDSGFVQCNSLLGDLLGDIGGIILSQLLGLLESLTSDCSNTCGSGGDLQSRLNVFLEAKVEADLQIDDVKKWCNNTRDVLDVITVRLGVFIDNYKSCTKQTVRTKCENVFAILVQFTDSVSNGCDYVSNLTVDVEVKARLTAIQSSCNEIKNTIQNSNS